MFRRILPLLGLLASPGFSMEIRTTGSGEVSAWPDFAEMRIETESLKPRLKDALAESREIQAQAIAIARRFAAREDLVEVAQTSTNRETEWDGKTRRERLLGFSATQRIEVRIDSLDNLSEFVDEILKLRSTRIAAVAFRTAREDSLRNEAVVRAVAGARRTGEAIAASQGLKVTGIKEATNYLERKKPERWEVMHEQSPEISVYGKGIGAAGISFSPRRLVYSSSAHVVLEAQ